MINTYFGTFKNIQELEAHHRESKISEYRKLAKMFSVHPSMELSCMMSDLALVLVNRFSLTWEEVEKLEA